MRENTWEKSPQERDDRRATKSHSAPRAHMTSPGFGHAPTRRRAALRERRAGRAGSGSELADPPAHSHSVPRGGARGRAAVLTQQQDALPRGQLGAGARGHLAEDAGPAAERGAAERGLRGRRPAAPFSSLRFPSFPPARSAAPASPPAGPAATARPAVSARSPAAGRGGRLPEVLPIVLLAARPQLRASVVRGAGCRGGTEGTGSPHRRHLRCLLPSPPRRLPETRSGRRRDGG